MTGAEVLAELVELALKYGPVVADGVSKIVVELKQKHPELDAPPPADEEATIDRMIDARLAAETDPTKP